MQVLQEQKPAFGTLKRKLRLYSIHSVETLACDLATYRFLYDEQGCSSVASAGCAGATNAVRPHQHLNGSTPAEIWNKEEISIKKFPLEFSAWNGALTGFYLPPS